jgi:hypothetical protein
MTNKKKGTKQRIEPGITITCGSETHPVPDRTRAIGALSRAEKHASPALFKRIRASICEKYPALPSCRKKDTDEWGNIAAEMEEFVDNLEGVEDSLLEEQGSPSAAPPEKTKPKDRPGGSNVGKYKGVKTFCGPAGGAPKGTYPVNTRKRAIAALAYARHAPNPAGIKRCVCRHWPSLPACKKKKDSDSDSLWNDTLVKELSQKVKHPVTGLQVPLSDVIFELKVTAEDVAVIDELRTMHDDRMISAEGIFVELMNVAVAAKLSREEVVAIVGEIFGEKDASGALILCKKLLSAS